jgi:hypothetical protein
VHAILESSDFRQWLLAGTKHETSAREIRHVGEKVQRELRSPTMKNPYWFNYWCGKDSKCACRIGTAIETDILLIFDCVNRRRLGLHIEIKRPGDELGEGQAETYPRRAACWATPGTKPRTVPPHQDFLTMLICGRNLEFDERIKYFDKTVFHDEVAMKIPVYPEV